MDQLQPIERPCVVVLNWNGADDTMACLRSLRESTVPLHLIVVDNGSTDGSLERLAAAALADDIMPAGVNLGFAEGNNLGLRAALDRGAEILVVLNNDTEVEPDAMEVLVNALREPRALALSPDIRYATSPDDSWFRGGVIDDGWPRHLQGEEAAPSLLPGDSALRPSPILTGCCVAAHRNTWTRVGLFDPAYFLIFEDSDWSVRAQRAGVTLAVAVRSRIVHHVSRSLDADGGLMAAYYFVRNGLLFQSRYFPSRRGAFVLRWILRPAPSLLRSGRALEVGFRFCGLLAHLASQSGRAPSLLERAARRLSRESVTA